MVNGEEMKTERILNNCEPADILLARTKRPLLIEIIKGQKTIHWNTVFFVFDKYSFGSKDGVFNEDLIKNTDSYDFGLFRVSKLTNKQKKKVLKLANLYFGRKKKWYSRLYRNLWKTTFGHWLEKSSTAEVIARIYSKVDVKLAEEDITPSHFDANLSTVRVV